MNNDLISREALLKAMEEERQYLLARGQTGAEHIIVHHCLPIIDNAPTVEYTFEEAFQKTVCEQRLYCPARPKGEWIEESSETGALGVKYTWVRCNQCGWNNSLVIPKNYCPNCGADMRKGCAE